MLAKTGTYILLLELDREMTIEIGKLGIFVFLPGYYAYVGSAFGPGGLKSRVGRHLKKTKNNRWHIDYLRTHSKPYEVWYTHHQKKQECTCLWQLYAMNGSDCPCKGFGSSDCACPSHLIYFKYKPSFIMFKKQTNLSMQKLSLSLLN
jgi:Uri superfamily endonuclease